MSLSESYSRGEIIRCSCSDVGRTTGQRFRPIIVPCYVNGIWRNIGTNIRLFVDDCILYRKITNSLDVEILQADLDGVGGWAIENEMKINASKSGALSFTRERVNVPLSCTLNDRKVSEESSCKYQAIIISSDLNWADQVNYTVQKAGGHYSL